jgi:sulfur-carrier protein
MIRVKLPPHLRTIAKVGTEIELQIDGPATQRAVFDALESNYPMLRGTIRDYDTQRRRSHLRLYACKMDLSHESPDSPLPEAVATGDEPLLIVGAISGG